MKSCRRQNSGGKGCSRKRTDGAGTLVGMRDRDNKACHMVDTSFRVGLDCFRETYISIIRCSLLVHKCIFSLYKRFFYLNNSTVSISMNE